MPSTLPINLENLRRQRQVEGERIEYKAGWKQIKAMAANGSPAPEFETDAERSYFLIRLPVHEKAANWAGLLPETSSEKSSEKTAHVALPDGTKMALSRHQVEILHQCLNESPIGSLMAITGRSDRTKFRNQVLQPLFVAGLIEMTLPDKPTSRLQKYRLTPKGRSLLHQT